MKTINRTVVFVSPKQPYIDWANSFNDDGPQIDPVNLHSTAFLIPDHYDEFSYMDFIEKHYSTIFELELESWMATPAHWPTDMTYTAFKNWFEVKVADTVFDLGSDKLAVEDY